MSVLSGLDSNLIMLHNMALDAIPDYTVHIRKLVEECNELAVCAAHFLDAKASPRDVEGEMADVLVMIHRLLMMPMFRDQRVSQIYEQKLLRLECKLKETK